MIRLTPAIIILFLQTPLISMIHAPLHIQPALQHDLKSTNIGNYWGSIGALEEWIDEYLKQLPEPKPEHYYFIYEEHIIDSWLIQHPGIIDKSIFHAAQSSPELFSLFQLPILPQNDMQRAFYLHAILNDILKRRLHELKTYEHALMLAQRHQHAPGQQDIPD